MFGRKMSLWKLKRLAKSGDGEASFEVGACYLNGISTEIDIDKAVEFFKMGAEQGNAGAAMTLGDMLECGYINGKGYRIADHDAAFVLFNIASDGGLAAGMHRMGCMYKDGRGAPQNSEKALALMIDAAERGWNPAQMDLYYMYRDGRGTEVDMDKAMEYLRMAAENNNEEAILRLEELTPKKTEE
ncbi:MAG TPA: tetratricopeptide repeat protein [Candidatus Methanomethylophilaceae archaeon]|nr:tetratricopeptide repeat protein [Candidatus Methanomethylophilaceae archaeon]